MPEDNSDAPKTPHQLEQIGKAKRNEDENAKAAGNPSEQQGERNRKEWEGANRNPPVAGHNDPEHEHDHGMER